MKKQISIILVICLLLCLTPTSALAEDTNSGESVQLVTFQRIGTTDSGFSQTGSSWKDATMPDSTGDTTRGVSKYSGSVGHYVQYTPTNLQPGWYDVSFWNIKYQDSQNPMKMTATIFSDSVTTENITLGVNTTSEDRGGIWTKIGTYYFAGTNDEYLRLVASGGSHARIADVKFELNESYQPPKATFQRIGTTDSGFSQAGSSWKNSTMADSTGDTTSGVSKYSGSVGHYVQYTPNNLQPGWYDVSFWNIKYQDSQNPMKMTATIFSGGDTTENITLGVNTTSEDRGGIWTKIGTYYFAGTDDEYLRLVASGGSHARIADAKFELNENYQPPKVTTQRIDTTDSGFSTYGDNWKPASMPDSTGNTTRGVSLYTNLTGSYAQYTPKNLEPGWYDISFWNIKYSTNQNPIKMTGTVFANGKTKENIKLPVNTETEDRQGIWSKVGTYYFSGTDDEYFRLFVFENGEYARVADVKFEKNDSFVPPPSFGDTEISLNGTDRFHAISKEGNYSVYINKTAATDGLLTLYANGAEIAKHYTNGVETGKIYLGTFSFPDDADVELCYVPLTGSAPSPVSTVYFVPASGSYAIYKMYNLQKDEEVFFFNAGMHKITADITNNSGSSGYYKLIGAVYENGILIKSVSSERIYLENGETEKLEVQVPITNSKNNTELKAFVWDDFSNIRPKVVAKAFQAQDDRIFGAVTITPNTFDSTGSWTIAGNSSAFTGTILSGKTSSSAETEPATVSLKLPENDYRIWVRTINYTTNPDARYFNVRVNGTVLDKTFGQIGQDGLFWEDGGVVALNGETLLEVLDTSKYYAKIDSIVITDDLDYTPADSFEQITEHAPILTKNPSSMTESAMMADFTMDKNYVGGNYILHEKGNNTVHISPDLSDTSLSDGWFYWNFKATSGSDRTVTFKITGCTQVIGASGAVYSTDGGNNWSYITESAKKTQFSYDFKANETVQFAVTIPYQYSNLTSYIGTLSSDRVAVSTLCKSEENRDVPLVTIGNPDAEKAVILTSRHHCCETTASYHLEGIMDYLSQDAPDSLFDTYCFYIVPMMDVDGVENGDQGKGRAPHDHNRDYQKDLYSSVRALKAFVADKDVEFFLDLHCPMLQTSKPYLYYSTEDKDAVADFSAILANATANSEYSNPIIFDGSRDYDSGDHYADCSRGYFFLEVGSPFATTLEFPYSGEVGDEYTVERIYNFGIDVAKAIETYITK